MSPKFSSIACLVRVQIDWIRLLAKVLGSIILATAMGQAVNAPVHAAPTEQWIPATTNWSSHKTGGKLGFGPTAEAALGEWIKYRIIDTANATPVQSCRLPLGQGQSFTNFSSIGYKEPRFFDDGWGFTTTLLIYNLTTFCTDPITIPPPQPVEVPGAPILEKLAKCPKNTTRSIRSDAKGRPQECLVAFDTKPLSQPCGCGDGRAPSCCRGNPMDVSTGVKRQQETDLAGPLPLVRTYSSERRRWEHNWDAYVLAPDDVARAFCLAADVVDHGFAGPIEPVCLARSNSASKIGITLAPQWLLEFDALSLKPVRADLPYRLESVGSNWMLRDLVAAKYHLLDKASGRLLSVHQASGRSFRLSYSAGLPAVWPAGAPACARAAQVTVPTGALACVSDDQGRQLTFSHVDGALSDVIDPAGNRIRYVMGTESASKGQISSVLFQDGFGKQYLYSEPGLVVPLNIGEPTEKFLPGLLTGIVDERGLRYASFHYNAMGGATRTEHAGVNAYTTSGSTVTTPLGAQEVFSFQEIQGLLRPTAITQPAGAGSSAATRTLEYNAAGQVVGNVGFDGFRTCYFYDPVQGVETSRVEGLPATTACASLEAISAPLPAGSRRVSTSWHPHWRLAVKVAAPLKTTTFVYNGQPDPFNGNAAASCAPASAVQADGRPIAVLCRQVEQATTDANGSQGLSATLDATTATRQQTWTYNQLGQVLSHDGPRTDVSDITRYAYHEASTADYLAGDLKSITNAALQTTRFTKYNRLGQLLEAQDPNGVLSTWEYDSRQRLTRTVVGGVATSIAYEPTGLPRRITQADGGFLAFEYDDAQRQKAVVDHRGNRVDFDLDAAGNRLKERVQDPQGQLKRVLTRVYDQLGRLQQVSGRE